MSYKWKTPYHWLKFKVRKWDRKKMREELLFLARKIDPDIIQDLYQEDMEIDGYFREED